MNDIPPGVAVAPQWALFAGQFGKDCILAGCGAFVVSAILWILQVRSEKLEKPAKWLFALGCVALLASFASLTLLFVKDQFEYAYVFQHGDSETELKYKIAGVWTSQEGSFLLWACTSAIFGLLTVWGTGIYKRWYTVVYSGFLACLSAILAYESPFGLFPMATVHGKTFVPPRGAGMTPSLQNYWVVIHPPTIFMGFGCLTVFFAYATAALLQGNAKDWISRARPWALLTTAILGIGIVMGGLWAYDTQGWGGFWAWDPVECASFVPWLFTVVLIHGILVQATRNKWAFTNLFLGGLPFLSFLYGTFLTRSGLLDKVSLHSFAEMNQSALVILRWFMILVTAGFVAAFFALGKRAASTVTPPTEEGPALEREGAYRYGMLLVSLIAIVITLGMSWPVIVALRGGQGSKVDEWLYHQVSVWFFIPIMLLMAVAPFVSWRGMSWKDLGNRLFTTTCLSIGVAGFAQMGLMAPKFGVHATPGATVAGPFHSHVPLPFWMMMLVFLCTFVAVANLWKIAEILKRSPTGIGGFVAHVGLAILFGGLILSRGYEQKDQIFVRPGSPAMGLGYVVSYKDRTHLDPRDRNGKVFFDVQGPDGERFTAEPGLYQFGSADDPEDMTWPHVQRNLSHDVYLAMQAPRSKVFEQPKEIKPGQTIDIAGDASIEYVRAKTSGPLGQVGAKFIASLKLTATGEDGERHEYLAEPAVQLTEAGLSPSLVPFGPDFMVAIDGMDAGDQSVPVELYFSTPVYPIEIYYKPLTGLVWLGTIVMTLGGLLSAWSRRRPKGRADRVPVEESTKPAKGSAKKRIVPGAVEVT